VTLACARSPAPCRAVDASFGRALRITDALIVSGISEVSFPGESSIGESAVGGVSDPCKVPMLQTRSLLSTVVKSGR